STPVFDQTAKSELTICTYCVSPASPFVSGGRHEHVLACPQPALNGRQIPSKFCSGPCMPVGPCCFCTTGSFAFDGVPVPGRWSTSRERICVTGFAGSTGRLETAGESPSYRPSTTFGPKLARDTRAVCVRAPAELASATCW